MWVSRLLLWVVRVMLGRCCGCSLFRVCRVRVMWCGLFSSLVEILLVISLCLVCIWVDSY